MNWALSLPRGDAGLQNKAIARSVEGGSAPTDGIPDLAYYQLARMLQASGRQPYDPPHVNEEKPCHPKRSNLPPFHMLKLVSRGA